jgi:hypothetical protein
MLIEAWRKPFLLFYMTSYSKGNTKIRRAGMRCNREAAMALLLLPFLCGRQGVGLQVREDNLETFTVRMLKARDTAAKVAVRKDIAEYNEKYRAEGKPSMIIKMEDVDRRVKRRRDNAGPKKATPKEAAKQQTRAAAWN